jgi:hypothetical protein
VAGKEEGREVVKVTDYLDMLAAVQDSVSGCLTQLSFLESWTKQLPIGQQRGVRAYFADTRSHLEQARKFLMEQEDWMIVYCFVSRLDDDEAEGAS